MNGSGDRTTTTLGGLLLIVFGIVIARLFWWTCIGLVIGVSMVVYGLGMLTSNDPYHPFGWNGAAYRTNVPPPAYGAAPPGAYGPANPYAPPPGHFAPAPPPAAPASQPKPPAQPPPDGGDGTDAAEDGPTCPQCGAPRLGRFCNQCGNDFGE